MSSRPIDGEYELWVGTRGEDVAVATAPPCPADINRDVAAGVQDIFDFLVACFTGCP